MIYRMISKEPLLDDDYLYQQDDELALNALVENNFSRSKIIVCGVSHADALKELDFIQAPSGVFLLSKKFLDLILDEIGVVPFDQAIFENDRGEDVLDQCFYQVLLNHFPGEYEYVDPIKYWPKFKKFKNFDFVIKEKSNHDVGIWVGREDEIPHYFLCSESFMQLCVDKKINTDFQALPTLDC